MHTGPLHRLFSVAALPLLAVLVVSCDDKPDFEPQVPKAAADLAPVVAPTPTPTPPVPATGPAPAVANNPTEAANPGDKPVSANVEAGADEAHPGGAHPALYVRSSRCGECHEKMHQEWGQSAHSHASRSPAFRKALAAAGDGLRGLCMRCHLPSQSYGQPDEQPGRPSEGVSCDGCHTIKAVEVGKNSSTIKFDPGSGAKYGPIVGATGHYFHDMAYSELHTKGELCSGCHHMTAYELGGKLVNIPVVSNYSDWKLYGKGKACQDCHMPSRGTEPVAKGAKPRPNVPAHIFAGPTTLGKQIRFELSKHSKPGEVAVEISHTAGHMLPSGYVDRRLIVRAEFYNAAGAKVGQVDRSYGIKLVDAANQPAPFFRAVKVAEDRRMIPGKPYTESFPIPAGLGPTQAPAPVAPAPPAAPAAPAAGPPVKATLSLLAASTAPELQAVYGEPELTVLKSTSLTLPVRLGGR